jgi:Flp pilus assembly protein CpaB
VAIGVRPAAWSLPRIERKYLVAGALAAASAVVVLVLTQPPERTAVLVAGSDIPAGVALAGADIDVRMVESADGLVVGSSVGELGGWSLAVPLGAGEPLLASLLRAPEVVASPNLLALALEAEHAVLGLLSAGDLVDVYLTTETTQGAVAETQRIASNVYIVEASVSEDSVDRGEVHILVAVDDDLAPILTSAARNGTIDLVKVHR